MPTTRKQQQKLQVDKSADGPSLSTSTSSTTATKRKQDDEPKGNGDSKQAEETPQDVKAAKGNAPTESNGHSAEKEDGPPPAKAAKVEDDAEKKQKEEDVPASTDQSKAAESKPDTEQVSSTEKKLDGKDTDTSGSGEDVKWDIVERGQPKVQPAQTADASDEPAAKCIDDTQNFHLLLLPRASDSSTAPAKSNPPEGVENKSEQTGEVARQGGIGARLIRLGKKRLPEPNAAIKQGDTPGGIGGDSSEAIWAVVSDVKPSFDSLKAGLAENRYSTKTAGDRVVQAARPVGRGWYVISVSQTEPPSSRQVRLSYALSHPHDDKDFGDVQTELGLHKESSVLLQMRNPTLPATGAGAPPAGLDPSSRAQLSDGELQETFGGNAESKGTNYARPENLDLLDRAGVELLMIKKREQEAEEAVAVGDTHQKTLEKLACESTFRTCERESELTVYRFCVGLLQHKMLARCQTMTC
ncbi:hypothetical protein BCV69DRAFT_197033 [Microstroma glucosiphilum]|uniref:Uncharacterized protein n=1 Tax=Pseudomicrostroma glucosiphilum TaxID=1684307 RepID=A0A316U621_9BASI|nr:hypothetical protein BCV69DRAFT_197033 [Pseudomicrostroma glucosiphilum]PWN20707.1 hypothetical protein BCV69DRAFT_197033 [Pseudomicrostroma glucosiphilum]